MLDPIRTWLSQFLLLFSIAPPRHIFFACVSDLMYVAFKFSIFSRFLLQGKSLVHFQMYSVHFA